MTVPPESGPVVAIVLAGGRSTRFGSDKLDAVVDGKPLLERAVSVVQSLADEVIVVLGPDDQRVLAPSVRVARDAVPFEGPLAGLATGLTATGSGRAIVVAGDMPGLVPAVLSRLLSALDEPTSVDAAVLDQPGGPRPLPMALRVAPAARAARTLLAGGERRLRALPGVLLTRVVDAEAWRVDDPTGRSLLDVDSPADLGRDEAG